VAAEPDCEHPKTDGERAICRARAVGHADEVLNWAYRIKRESLEAAGQARLRSEQRAWIRERDATCGVTPSGGGREWLKRLAQDAERTECVIRVTRDRIKLLGDDPRHDYDLLQTLRESKQDIVFSVRVHPSLPRFSFRVVWQDDGAPDSAGGKLIERIEVSREGEIKPRQLLTGRDELNQTIYTPRRVLRADDANFDGYLDIGIVVGEGATGNEGWAYWLYDPRTGEFATREDLEFWNPSFDPKTKTIHTGMKCGMNCYEYAIYAWRNGQPVLIDRGVSDEDNKDPD